MTVSLSGFKALDAALGELPKATAKNVLKRVLIKAAQPIEDSAVQLAPRLTGRLAASIIIGTKLTRSQQESGPVLTADGYRSASKNYVEIYVGTALPRGQFEEFGTIKNHPQPFMRPAWDGHKEESLAIIAGLLGTEITKAAARYAKKLGNA